MKRRFMKILWLTTVMFFFSVTLSNSLATASLVDKIYDKHMYSGPSYFETQKRGYFSLGTFSARADFGTVHPISISLPRIDVGCGGIDLFLGGFGFTNLEYLVDKFQKLIQMAPFVAFRIALNTLSPQIGNILDVAESIVNALNSLQFDECRFMRPFMAISLRDEPSQQFERAASAALQEMGVSGLWTSITSGLKNLSRGSSGGFSGSVTVPKKRDLEQAIDKGCPQPLANKFKSYLSRSETTFISEFMNNLNVSGMLGSELKSILLGLVGDLNIKVQNQGSDALPLVVVHRVSPCDGALEMLLKEGKVCKATGHSGNKMTCTCEETLSGLENKVKVILERGYNQALVRGRLPSDFESLANSSPIPVYMLLKYAIIARDPGILTSSAKFLAHYMFYSTVVNLASQVKGLSDALMSAEGQVMNAAQCPLANIQEAIKEFSRVDLTNLENTIYSQLSYKSSELNSIVGLIVNYMRFYDYMIGKFSREFSPALAQKMAGK